MAWVDRAKSNAQSKAELDAAQRQQAAKDKTAFDAELPVTEEQVTAFLQPFAAPIESIVADLREAGFSVEEQAPGYMFDSDVGDRKEWHYLDKFSLAKTKPSYRGLTDYRVNENHVFGLQWHIKYQDGKYLASIRIYPKTNGKTHFAAVEYLIPGSFNQKDRYSQEVSDPSQSSAVIPELQAVLTEIIEESAVQRARESERRQSR